MHRDERRGGNPRGVSSFLSRREGMRGREKERGMSVKLVSWNGTSYKRRHQMVASHLSLLYGLFSHLFCDAPYFSSVQPTVPSAIR